MAERSRARGNYSRKEKIEDTLESARRKLKWQKTSMKNVDINDPLKDVELGNVYQHNTKQPTLGTKAAKLEEINALMSEAKVLLEHMTKEEKQQTLSLLLGYAKQRARQNFYVYVQLMAPLVLPEGFKDGKHIRVICDELQGVERCMTNQIPRRLMLFAPPGSMKSKLMNLFVTWIMGRNPRRNILHVGHGTQFVEDNSGRPIRDLMRTPEFLELFPRCEIRHDARASGRWDTREGGKYYAAGVGSNIAGRRAHLSICDDVVSEQTAFSEVERKNINSWYVPGLRTRLLPNACEVIINTRWHIDDLSGALLQWDSESKIPWRVVSLPAILDKSGSELLGLPEKTSYWPEFWGTEELERKRSDKGMSEAKWNALYMQNPTPEEGNIIKEDDFKIWTHSEPPDVERVIVSIDTAFSTKETANFSAYTVWGVYTRVETDIKGFEHRTANLILLESEKGRWDFPSLCEKIQEVYNVYNPDVLIIEKKASGQSLIQEMQRRQLPVWEYLPDKDKISRVHACTPFFRSGRIWLPDASKLSDSKWIDEFRLECLQFPYGTYDDLVDTLSQSVLWARDTYSLSNKSYPGDTEDEEDRDNRIENMKRKKKTYWGLVTGRF